MGKTTLLHRFIKGEFLANIRTTIGVEFFVEDIIIDGIVYKLQLRDLGVEMQFRFILNSYISGASGALLMFDLTRIKTLYRIGEWVEMLRAEDPNLPILFIGTKLIIIRGKG